MKLFWMSAFVLGTTLIASGYAVAATSADPRVDKVLKETGYSYRVTSLGNASVHFISVETGRTQLVFISAHPSTVEKASFRNVYTFVYESDTPLDESFVHKLLELNSTYSLGAWTLNHEGSKQILMFVASIPADADSATLEAAIRHVAITGDHMELELTNENKK